MVTAHNPILCGFYPDPSICRVGKDFYITNSSFVYAPGVPIFHSRDLAHWEQIGNVLDRPEQLLLDNEEISRGIFAPTIRYHQGLFYMITTNVSNGGNFIVTAEKPEGPWSDPYYLEDAPGIDPSLFFDEDGKCYYVGTRPNPEGVRYNGDWEIWVQELDIEQMKLVGESMAIWKGAVKDVIWPEGPHLYKKDGYYYLLHAEGGTGPEHAISVARSQELFKWFEGCPRNPIFSHRNLGQDYPVIYAGHGDLVDDENGNYYIVMLATRPCKKHGSMGRETFLAKVIWEDGWPVINPGVGKLEDEVELPFEECRFENEFSGSDHFRFFQDKLDDRILGISRRDESIYSLSERPGFLRLYNKKDTIETLSFPAFLGIRQKSYSFSCSTGLFFNPMAENETAGLVLFQNHENNLKIELCIHNGLKVVRVTSNEKANASVLAICVLKPELQKKNVLSNNLIELEIRGENQKADILLKYNGSYQQVISGVDLLPYTTEEAGGFVGCTMGLYASANNMDSDNYADFAWLSYSNM